MTIPPISGPQRTTDPRTNNTEKKEQVAAGVGGAAGLSQATKMAGKKGLQAEKGEKALQQMLNTVQATTQTVNKNSKAVEGLWGTFKYNIQMYSKDILMRLEKFKNSKFIGPIVNSPITKKLSTVAGGALAFFVLVTGVNKAVKTGAIAIDDFKNQINEFKSVA